MSERDILVHHLARAYADRAFKRYRKYNSPKTAGEEAMREENQMRTVLDRVKTVTLEHLHEELHQECLNIDGDWITVIITEFSLEGIMAAKKATKTAAEQTVKLEIRYVPDAKLGAVYAKAQLGSPDGFLDVSDMELVDMPGFKFVRRAPTHPRNLETIYNFYQKLDGAPEERTAQLKKRSMSVGDAIVIDGVPYYVAAQGFVTKAPDGTLAPVEVPGA